MSTDSQRRTLLPAAILAVLAAACQPAPGATPPSEPGPVWATVGAVDVLILESFPVQVRVVVRGDFVDACWTVTDMEVSREADTFRLALVTDHGDAEFCAATLTPFEASAALDAAGLPKGTYTVQVGEVRTIGGRTSLVTGIRASFTLAVDNVLPAEPA